MFDEKKKKKKCFWCVLGQDYVVDHVDDPVRGHDVRRDDVRVPAVLVGEHSLVLEEEAVQRPYLDCSEDCLLGALSSDDVVGEHVVEECLVAEHVVSGHVELSEQVDEGLVRGGEDGVSSPAAEHLDNAWVSCLERCYEDAELASLLVHRYGGVDYRRAWGLPLHPWAHGVGCRAEHDDHC